MTSFFERRGYSAQTLKHDLEKMRQLSQSDALTKSNSTKEKMNRIPLILTYHPLNSRVQRILLDNFKVIADDPATSFIFPQPPMVAFRRNDNLRTSLVHTAEKQAATRAGTYPCQHPRCRTCGHISSKTDLLGPKDHVFITDSFTWLSFGLIYCISCRRCPAISSARLGALWGNVLVNISEALTRMCLVFPSQSISVLTDIPQTTHWSVGLNSAKGTNRGKGRRCVSSFDSGHASRAASMLIFTSFEVRARAKRNFQILNSTPGIVAQLITNIPLMKGTVPKCLDIC